MYDPVQVLYSFAGLPAGCMYVVSPGLWFPSRFCHNISFGGNMHLTDAFAPTPGLLICVFSSAKQCQLIMDPGPWMERTI